MTRLGIVGGTPKGLALGRAIRALADAEVLPNVSADVAVLIPPVRTAYARRVAGENLWLWFRLEGDEVVIVGVTGSPPVPLV